MATAALAVISANSKLRRRVMGAILVRAAPSFEIVHRGTVNDLLNFCQVMQCKKTSSGACYTLPQAATSY